MPKKRFQEHITTKNILDGLGSIPWVAVIPGKAAQRPACQGLKYSGMPLYAFWKMSKNESQESANQRAAAARKKHGCKLKAQYVFINLEGELFQFCRHHLHSQGLQRDM